jgi:hypothetical protein
MNEPLVLAFAEPLPPLEENATNAPTRVTDVRHETTDDD